VYLDSNNYLVADCHKVDHSSTTKRLPTSFATTHFLWVLAYCTVAADRSTADAGHFYSDAVDDAVLYGKEAHCRNTIVRHSFFKLLFFFVDEGNFDGDQFSFKFGLTI
jgi:hypothetical protein